MHPEDRTQILLEDIRSQFGILTEHIDGVEQRLTRRIEGLEVRMDRLEYRMDKLEGRMDKLEYRMDRLEMRMDSIETLVNQHDRDIKAIRTQLPN